jgi:hypothetical protein
MSDSPNGHEIVGRGAKEGGRLFREWFERLSGAPERGDRVAYVFVMGSISEILRAFDFKSRSPKSMLSKRLSAAPRTNT